MAQANALDAFKNFNTDLLEDTKIEFYKQVDAYIERVKGEILTSSSVAQAIEFLTQPVPDSLDIGPTQAAKQQADVKMLKNEIESLKNEIQYLKSRMIKMKKSNEKQLAKAELKAKRNAKKISDMDTEQKEMIQVFSQKLSVLQKFIKNDLQVQTTGQGAQAGATYGQLMTSFPPPTSASLQLSFSPKHIRDRWDTDIQDIVLLSGGLIVAADGGNQTVKVFDFGGRFLHTHQTPGEFCSLTVMPDGHVAIMDRVSKTLEMLVVSIANLKLQSSHKVTKSYFRIKSTKPNNLVASVARMVNFKWTISSEIDILDSSGVLLRSLSTSSNIYHFCPTNDNSLIWTYDNTIVKTDLTNGRELWRSQVPKTSIIGLCGVAMTRDSSVVVNNFRDKTLLLLSADGNLKTELWQADRNDNSGVLKNAYITEDICLVSTERKIFVLKLV